MALFVLSDKQCALELELKWISLIGVQLAIANYMHNLWACNCESLFATGNHFGVLTHQVRELNRTHFLIPCTNTHTHI